jgi:hypothetical protein
VSRDDRTYTGVRQKYDEWVDLEANRPERDRLRRTDDLHSTEHREGNQDMSRMVFSAIGIGIGVILLLLSAYAFYTASYWSGFGRDGAAVGYMLVGFFLLVAGGGGIIATYNHNFRVLVRPPEHH